jgi:hypothetical protein
VERAELVIPVGFLLTWGGYAISSWGWLLLQGYNVTLGTWLSPLHPYSGAWPPEQIPAGQMFPGKAGAGGSSGSGGGSGLPPNSGWTRPNTSGNCPPRSTRVRQPDGKIACIPWATSPKAM